MEAENAIANEEKMDRHKDSMLAGMTKAINEDVAHSEESMKAFQEEP